MPALPPGWESDYDGTRWLYRYRANGHIQYHFPSEGDEFPDYIDALSPAPVLAPEEKRESQLQVKRHGGSAAQPLDRVTDGVAAEKVLPWQAPYGGLEGRRGEMSATAARPVSFLWEEDGDPREEEEAEAVFRPESFMFLGPGTYTDVSPLQEDEDEAAKRVVTGEGRLKGVSPVVRTGATPLVENIELNASAGKKGQDTPSEPPSASGEEDVIHMIDGREMPMELPGSEPWQDPVGRLPEMATAETHAANIETNPPPVEIGEGKELHVVGELPAMASEPKVRLDEKPKPDELRNSSRQSEGDDEADATDDAIRRYVTGQDTIEEDVGAVNETPMRPSDGGAALSSELEITFKHKATPQGTTAEPEAKASEDRNVEASAAQPRYQPYKPEAASHSTPRATYETSNYQSSLQRERSLMMGPWASGGQALDTNTMPASLHVSKPRANNEDPATSQPHATLATASDTTASAASFAGEGGTETTGQGVSKFPSVLRPARGRAMSQPEIANDVAAVQGPSQKGDEYQPSRTSTDQAGQKADGIVRKPIASSGPVQDRLVYDGFNPTYSVSSTAFVPPRAATALPTTIPRTNSATSRKAVPQRIESTTVPQKLLDGREYATATAPPQAAHSQPPPRRHSNFSPYDVSPLASRSGSMSYTSSLGSPSPMEETRRGSSGVSLAQSASSGFSFTPSPSSTTPGSDWHGVVSPMSGGATRPRPQGIESSGGSYFPEGLPGDSAQDRRLPRNQQQPSSREWRGQSPGLQRSQSMRQTPSPHETNSSEGSRGRLSVTGQPLPGHLLTSIEEHEENASSHDGRSTNNQSPGLSRRHSVASNSNPSPKRMNPVLPYQMHDGPVPGHPSQYQARFGQPPGPNVPIDHRHAQQQIGTVLPADQQPNRLRKSGPVMHNEALQSPQRIQMAQQTTLPHDSRMQQPSHPQAPTGWQPQRNRPISMPPQLLSAASAPTTAKEKDKKWTKWFKSTKSAASGSQPSPVAQVPSQPGEQSPLPPWSAQQVGWQHHHHAQQQKQQLPKGQTAGHSHFAGPWPQSQVPPHAYSQHGQPFVSSEVQRPIPPVPVGQPGAISTLGGLNHTQASHH